MFTISRAIVEQMRRFDRRIPDQVAVSVQPRYQSKGAASVNIIAGCAVVGIDDVPGPLGHAKTGLTVRVAKREYIRDVAIAVSSGVVAGNVDTGSARSPGTIGVLAAGNVVIVEIRLIGVGLTAGLIAQAEHRTFLKQNAVSTVCTLFDALLPGSVFLRGKIREGDIVPSALVDLIPPPVIIVGAVGRLSIFQHEYRIQLVIRLIPQLVKILQPRVLRKVVRPIGVHLGELFFGLDAHQRRGVALILVCVAPGVLQRQPQQRLTAAIRGQFLP